MKEHLRKMIDVRKYEKDNDAKDLNSIKEREFAQFWQKRARDASIWSLILNTANFVSTSLFLFKPVSEK